MDNHYYMIKAKAKQLLAKQQPYYISLTALANIGFIIIRFVSTIILMTTFFQIVQASTAYYYVGNSLTTPSIFNYFVGFLFFGSPGLIFVSWLNRGMDIKFLEWYRKETVSDKASGIKDSFALFSHNRFFPYTILSILVLITKMITAGIAGLIATWMTLFIALFNSLDSTTNFFAAFLGAIIFWVIKSLLDLFISQVYLIYYDLMSQNKASFALALAKSLSMISKNLTTYIWLNMSFIGWNILDFCCFGILRLAWLDAYMRMTYVGFYDYMKERESIG
ncbi:hypothetical protein R4Y45_02155 [Holzapfeliella sp. He02]|uniref:DUF975 family protein n=1 Tax=Holzapfeliella saturejae TaxID=3082953 RepID=A0ABU8SFB9_9LACO